MPYVYSTLTCDNRYTAYTSGGDGSPIEAHSVLIKGGSNSVGPLTLLTPYGVRTEVSADDLAFLETIPAFRQHRDNGFIVVSGDKVDPEVAAADMETRDASAPMTPEDIKSLNSGAKLSDAKPGRPGKAA